jgi:hypothetical protein
MSTARDTSIFDGSKELMAVSTIKSTTTLISASFRNLMQYD